MHYQLSEGMKSESQLLSGVVCTKNVVHKMMKTDIVEPDILLLAIPLEYQRVQLKLSALDPVWTIFPLSYLSNQNKILFHFWSVLLKQLLWFKIVIQEQAFYKHLVSRITSRKPHVVLVQCTVSHIAQTLLLQAGISLVINVKPVGLLLSYLSCGSCSEIQKSTDVENTEHSTGAHTVAIFEFLFCFSAGKTH